MDKGNDNNTGSGQKTTCDVLDVAQEEQIMSFIIFLIIILNVVKI